ncbi:MAG: TfoX/Sxy family DNA transformation protein [Pseudomonadota bacterium]
MTADTSTDPEGVRALAELACIGLTSARLLAEAGVPDPKTLRRIGPIEAYRRLRFQFGERIKVNWIYAMECALHGMRFADMPPARVHELRAAARAVAKELASRAKPSP